MNLILIRVFFFSLIVIAVQVVYANDQKKINIMHHGKTFEESLDSKRNYLIEKSESLKIKNRVFSDFNDAIRNRDYTDKNNILYCLKTIGAGYSLENQAGCYLRDTVIYEIYVEALHDSEEYIRKSAFETIEKMSTKRNLVRYEERIRNALNQYIYPDSILILCKLPLSSNKKKEILKQKEIPDHIRASLGDTECEQKLINQFNSESDFFRKAKLANELGFVGTKKCGEALVNSLKSDIVYENHGKRISIKAYILNALGRIHDENKLLTYEICLILKLGDDLYGGKQRIEEFLHEVYSFCKKKYSIEPWEHNPEPLINKKLFYARFELKR